MILDRRASSDTPPILPHHFTVLSRLQRTKHVSLHSTCSTMFSVYMLFFSKRYCIQAEEDMVEL